VQAGRTEGNVEAADSPQCSQKGTPEERKITHHHPLCPDHDQHYRQRGALSHFLVAEFDE
jgi:hypothetical protein